MGRRKKKRDKRYPSFNRRMMAGTIDSILLVMLLPVVDAIAPINEQALQSLTADQNDPHAFRGVLLQIITNGDFISSWLLNLAVQLIIFCIYSYFCWKRWSSTPGKLFLRLKIVDEKTDAPMTQQQIITRLLGYWVSTFTFMLGFFWISIDKRGRAWHDLMAGTVVIAVPWKKKEDPAEAITDVNMTVTEPEPS